jgi:DNA-binding transcriptional LysR family regulator
MVAEFLSLHPQVRLEVVSETSFVDIVAEGFDAGIRWGEHLARDMVALPLGPPERYVVAASPDLLARVGAPEHPRDLLLRPCVQIRFPSGAQPPWEFERGDEVVRISPAGPLVTSNPTLMIEAAVGGAGFIATFEGYLAEHLAAGRLVAVLTEWCEPFSGPFLYYPSRRQTPSALRALIDFVQSRRRREGW